MTPALHFAARSDVGLIRQGNEDAVYAGPRLLAVADGMGGHAAGEVASAVAIANLAPLDDDAPGRDLLDMLRRAALTANDQLRRMVSSDSALDGMGTTLTAVLSAGSRLGLIHIGDSRAYLFRDGELTQITHDHTLVQSLVDEGRLSVEEAGSHPQRSLLTRVLDGRDGVDLDLSVREVRRGDRYLLCSDGLSSVVSPQTMITALQLSEPSAAVDQLVELALRGGGPDNISCIVADVVEATDGTDEPVIGGAAAGGGRPAAQPPDSPAARAALVGRREESTAVGDAPDRAVGGREAPTRPRHGRRGRWAAATAVVLIGLAAGTLAVRYYLRTQYFVGADHRQVAVFRGVSGSVAGVKLASVQQRPGIAVGDLPPVVQARLREGITAKDRADADRITDRLRLQAAPAQAPPEPSPSPTVLPASSPLPTASPEPNQPAPAPGFSTAPNP